MWNGADNVGHSWKPEKYIQQNLQTYQNSTTYQIPYQTAPASLDAKISQNVTNVPPNVPTQQQNSKYFQQDSTILQKCASDYLTAYGAAAATYQRTQSQDTSSTAPVSNSTTIGQQQSRQQIHNQLAALSIGNPYSTAQVVGHHPGTVLVASTQASQVPMQHQVSFSKCVQVWFFTGPLKTQNSFFLFNFSTATSTTQTKW